MGSRAPQPGWLFRPTDRAAVRVEAVNEALPSKVKFRGFGGERDDGRNVRAAIVEEDSPKADLGSPLGPRGRGPRAVRLRRPTVCPCSMQGPRTSRGCGHRRAGRVDRRGARRRRRTRKDRAESAATRQCRGKGRAHGSVLRSRGTVSVARVTCALAVRSASGTSDRPRPRAHAPSQASAKARPYESRATGKAASRRSAVRIMQAKHEHAKDQ